MQISIELSYYPLRADYREPVLACIEALRAIADAVVVSSATSTTLHGDSAALLPALAAVMEQSWARDGSAVFVAKFIGRVDNA